MKEETLDEVSKKLAFKAVRSGTYSDYDPDYNHPKRDAIKKAIGRKWGSEAEKHANKMVGDEGTGKIKSSGKSNRLKSDMLYTSSRVTASGKKHKQDVASTKRNIKDRLGTHPKPHLPEETLAEKAPPGREKQVLALKKKFPKGSGSPFAIAWSSYNKSKGE